MSQIIIDCSVAMAWAFPDEASAATIDALSLATADGIIVPAIWPLEVANVLAMCERRGRITVADSLTFLRMIQGLNTLVENVPMPQVFDALLDIARRCRLTIYDASYLELAQRRGLPLYTKDRELLSAAANEGVSVIDVSQ